MSSRTVPATEVELHLVFVPFLAPGYMNPMVDIAMLFAAHGVTSTIITTPRNALLYQSSVESAGLPVHLQTVEFPGAQVGLPEGIENLADITHPEMAAKLYEALMLSRNSIESVLRDIKPDFIIGDVFFPCLAELAFQLDIPRLVFDGGNFFNICIQHCLILYAPHRAVSSDSEAFIVPGLPDEIKMTRLQLPDWITTTGPLPDWLKHIALAQQKCYGKLVNTFSQLEASYEHFSKTSLGVKSWSIGPVFLWSKKLSNHKYERDNLTFDDYEGITNWLDARTPSSVIYVSFGTLIKIPAVQLKEVALALESCGKPFVLVVRNRNIESDGEDNCLPDGFEQRTKEAGNGYIIHGWAPQLLILKHPAVGGFLTHCGWNSIIEGVSYGLPMVTWPQSADQFHNEKLVTDVLKIGVAVGASQWFNFTTNSTPEHIGRDKIHKAVTLLMDTGEDSANIRQRARELANAARKAVDSNGTSHSNLKSLMDELKSMKRKPK